MMADKDTLKRLAKRHPEFYPVHMDIKKLIPQKDALNLLYSGFRDCSWGNDECPSFFADHGTYKGDVMTLMAIDDVNSDGERISDKITYTVCGHDIGWNNFANIDNAITYYNHLLLEGE
jgi:hypothetical protein